MKQSAGNRVAPVVLAMVMSIAVSAAPAVSQEAKGIELAGLGCLPAKSKWTPFIAPGKQSAKPANGFETVDYTVLSVRFGSFKGMFPKLYSFMILNKKNKCIKALVSVGSYEPTTQLSRKNGRIGPKERLYHIDLYAAKSHATFYLATTPPSFEQVAQFVRAFVNGAKPKPVSSTK